MRRFVRRACFAMQCDITLAIVRSTTLVHSSITVVFASSPYAICNAHSARTRCPFDNV
jgi:hypothetical protein